VVPAMLANCAAYLFASITLPWIRLDPEARRGHAAGGSVLREVVDGFLYVARHPGMGPLFLFAGLIGVLIRPVQEMLPPYIDRLFHQGAGGLATVSSVIGVAALIGGLLIALRGRLSGLARLAVLAGARLLVTPTLEPEVISTAQRYGAATVIGTATPTEMLRAQSLGADLVKIFPASQWTPKTLADVLQALPQLRCVPTGGVTLDNAPDWIAAGAVAVGIGSALTRGDDPAARVSTLLAALRNAA